MECCQAHWRRFLSLIDWNTFRHQIGSTVGGSIVSATWANASFMSFSGSRSPRLPISIMRLATNSRVAAAVSFVRGPPDACNFSQATSKAAANMSIVRDQRPFVREAALSA